MNDIHTEHQHHRQTLVNDADALLADVKALLKDLADEADLEVAQASPVLGARLQHLRSHLDELRKVSRRKASGWTHVTDGYVHAHPWKSVAAAAAVAALAAVAGAMTVPLIAKRWGNNANDDPQL